MVLAAEQYASRLVVPSRQQHPPMRWSSHKDHARKALAKLAGPNLPATLEQVEKAVAKATADHEQATRPANRQPDGSSAAVHEAPTEPDVDAVDEPVDEELEGEDLEDEGPKPAEEERLHARQLALAGSTRQLRVA